MLTVGVTLDVEPERVDVDSQTTAVARMDVNNEEFLSLFIEEESRVAALSELIVMYATELIDLLARCAT
jgi:hypothetical protein